MYTCRLRCRCCSQLFFLLFYYRFVAIIHQQPFPRFTYTIYQLCLHGINSTSVPVNLPAMHDVHSQFEKHLFIHRKSRDMFIAFNTERSICYWFCCQQRTIKKWWEKNVAETKHNFHPHFNLVTHPLLRAFAGSTEWIKNTNKSQTFDRFFNAFFPGLC